MVRTLVSRVKARHPKRTPGVAPLHLTSCQRMRLPSSSVNGPRLPLGTHGVLTTRSPRASRRSCRAAPDGSDRVRSWMEPCTKRTHRACQEALRLRSPRRAGACSSNLGVAVDGDVLEHSTDERASRGRRLLRERRVSSLSGFVHG